RTASIVTNLPVAFGLHLPHYAKLNWHEFHKNLDGLREFFWSVRVVEWFAVAGLVGLLRRSPAKALLIGGWFGTFLLIKGTSPGADIEEGTFLRLFMPALQALRRADGVHLAWRSPTSAAQVYYRVFRSRTDWIYDYRLPHRINGVRCLPPNAGAADCHLEMQTLAITRDHAYVDRSRLSPA